MDLVVEVVALEVEILQHRMTVEMDTLVVVVGLVNAIKLVVRQEMVEMDLEGLGAPPSTGGGNGGVAIVLDVTGGGGGTGDNTDGAGAGGGTWIWAFGSGGGGGTDPSGPGAAGTGGGAGDDDSPWRWWWICYRLDQLGLDLVVLHMVNDQYSAMGRWLCSAGGGGATTSWWRRWWWWWWCHDYLCDTPDFRFRKS